MWDLPGPGLEPVSPAMTGGFLTTVPPGKPQVLNLKAVVVRVFDLLSFLVLWPLAQYGDLLASDGQRRVSTGGLRESFPFLGMKQIQE